MRVFLKTLLLPLGLLLLDACPDIMLVDSYRQEFENENSTSHYQDFEACRVGNLSTNRNLAMSRIENSSTSKMGNLSTSMPYVCFPVKLGKKPKFLYALAFIISPWFFYLFEYFHSDHCMSFKKVGVSFHSKKSIAFINSHF